MSESKGKIFFSILAALLLLSGCIILLYPSLNGLWVDYTMRQNAQEFLSYVEVKPFTPGESIPSETISQEGAEEAAPPTEYTQLWLDMQSYNRAIFEEGQTGLSKPAAYEEHSFCLTAYGLESEVFGVLSIPRLEIQMPIYLGASKQNMANGAAVMG